MNRGYLAGILIFLCGSLHRPELFPVHKPGVVLTVVNATFITRLRDQLTFYSFCSFWDGKVFFYRVIYGTAFTRHAMAIGAIHEFVFLGASDGGVRFASAVYAVFSNETKIYRL